MKRSDDLEPVHSAGRAAPPDLIHGGALDELKRAFPDAPQPWLDLSTGINPFPYPNTAVSPASLQDLPTASGDHTCRSALAKSIGAPPDTILLAPGSELLIRLLPQVLALRTVAVLAPTYGDHSVVWEAAGCTVINTSEPLARCDEVDAVVLCNPNNPDGRCFQRDELEQARRQLAEKGGWLIVDEAYTYLDPALSLAPATGRDGLLVLRSMGKFYGLAGLRLGAVLGPPRVLSDIRSLLGVWPVSGAALEIATRAYADVHWQSHTRSTLREARERLNSILTDHGLEVAGGTSLFAYARTADAHRLWCSLAESGIYVRRFSWSQEHIRIGLPQDKLAETRLSATLAGLSA